MVCHPASPSFVAVAVVVVADVAAAAAAVVVVAVVVVIVVVGVGWGSVSQGVQPYSEDRLTVVQAETAAWGSPYHSVAAVVAAAAVAAYAFGTELGHL